MQLTTIAKTTFSPVGHYPPPASSRPRIVMMAYYCSPFRGSDWRVGWGRAVEAARAFDVFVVTSECSRRDIETYLRQNGVIPHVRFFYVDCQKDSLAGRVLGEFLYTDPLAYARWQNDALRLTHRLHARHCFHLAHHVSLIGFREPGRLHELGIPFIWGPIGGTQNCPFRFLLSEGLAGGVKELSRSIVNSLQIRFSLKVRRAVKSAAVVLAANSEGQRAVEKHHGRKAILLLETGIDVVEPKRSRPTDQRGPLRILWSGQLVPRKGLRLLLEALGSLREDLEFELRVLGQGPLMDKARRTTRRLGIERYCDFRGFLPLAEAMSQSEWADVFVFTSLRDTSGNVMLEAMSRGVPVICLDHQGARDIVTEDSGIKIPVTNRQDAIQAIAQNLKALGSDSRRLASLSEGAARRAEDFLWSRNGIRMSAIYKQVLDGSLEMSFSRKASMASALR